MYLEIDISISISLYIKDSHFIVMGWFQLHLISMLFI